MHVSKINYSKLFSLGNYENEKIECEVTLEPGESPQDAIQKARQFVEFNHKVNGLVTELEQCEHILNSTDNFTGNQVKQARERKMQIEAELRGGSNLLTT